MPGEYSVCRHAGFTPSSSLKSILEDAAPIVADREDEEDDVERIRIKLNSSRAPLALCDDARSFWITIKTVFSICGDEQVTLTMQPIKLQG